MSSARYFWEDFPVGHTRSFGHRVVTEAEIIAFAVQFDPQPFHTDEAAAAVGPFQGLVGSGWHSCSLAMRLICDGYLLASAGMGSPGLDRISWPAPLKPGDTLRMTMEVLEARAMKSRPDVGLIQTRHAMLAERTGGGEETILLMEGWSMFRRRAKT